MFSDINQVGEIWSPGNVDFAYFPACRTQKLIQKLIHGPGGSLGALRTAWGTLTPPLRHWKSLGSLGVTTGRVHLAYAGPGGAFSPCDILAM